MWVEFEFGLNLALLRGFLVRMCVLFLFTGLFTFSLISFHVCMLFCGVLWFLPPFIKNSVSVPHCKILNMGALSWELSSSLLDFTVKCILKERYLKTVPFVVYPENERTRHSLTAHLSTQFLFSSPVLEANTVVNIGTVVIKMLHTSVTNPTMLCAQWSHQSTRMTEILQRILPSLRLPLFVKWNLG